MTQKKKKVGKEKKEVVKDESSNPQELSDEKPEKPNDSYLLELERKQAREEIQKIKDMKDHLAEGMRLINEGLAYLLATDRILESKGLSQFGEDI